MHNDFMPAVEWTTKSTAQASRKQHCMGFVQAAYALFTIRVCELPRLGRTSPALSACRRHLSTRKGIAISKPLNLPCVPVGGYRA